MDMVVLVFMPCLGISARAAIMSRAEGTIITPDSIPFGLHVASVVENNVHACVGTILTGLHLLTLCSCTTRWYSRLRVYVAKDPALLKAVGGSANLMGPARVLRDVRFVFPHPYCGGNLSQVDLSVLQLWNPWPLTKRFSISELNLDVNTTYFDYIYETKHLSNPICQTASWWRYGTVQAPQSSSPLVNSTKDLKFIVTKVVRTSFCLPFEIADNGEKTIIETFPKQFEQDKMCGMQQLDGIDYCGVDKGAPLTCKLDTLGWRLYGIGLGGTSCNGKQSLSLFQGFSNSLSYMRLYLGFDLTLRTP